ncbi:N-6 DNA methylase [Kitasatospora sp. NPDC086791]|uniref:N-6 DNA methylase n=1 Tax=Kitasatospora sp. NPDC086791 TaxID=3155178 RepID=UPI003447DCB8
MTEGSARFASRSEIAKHAGVRRPAVTNWERRHPDYPEPVLVEGAELFAVDAVAAWLSQRTIPANALNPDERPGTTYGDRFRRSAGIHEKTEAPDRALSRRLATTLLGPLGEPWRHSGRESFYLELLLSLVLVRGCAPAAWSAAVYDLPDGRSPIRSLSRIRADVLGPEDDGWTGEGEGPVTRPEQWSLGRACRLIDEVTGTSQAADLFGQLLQSATERPGKRGEQLVTPPSLRQLMVGLAGEHPRPSVIHDPFCRSGELLVEFGGSRYERGSAVDLAVAETPKERHRRIAAMNLMLHGVPFRTEIAPYLPSDHGRTGRATYDLVLTNPPFSMKAPFDAPFVREEWPFGTPPERNADLGWIQHAVRSLNPAGRAIVVMANGAAFRGGREREIRTRLLSAGAVEGVIALPPGLFSSTSIGVCLWLLRHPVEGPPPDVLFVDAREAGEMNTRTLRALTRTDVSELVAEYRAWRRNPQDFTGTHSSRWSSSRATFAEITEAEFSLDPARYARRSGTAIDAAAVTDRLQGIRGELAHLHARASDVDQHVARLLDGMP